MSSLKGLARKEAPRSSAWRMARSGAPGHPSGFIHRLQGARILGEIDADVQNGHGSPLPNPLPRLRTSPSSRRVASCRFTAVRSGWGSPLHSLGIKRDSPHAVNRLVLKVRKIGSAVLWTPPCLCVRSCRDPGLGRHGSPISLQRYLAVGHQHRHPPSSLF